MNRAGRLTGRPTFFFPIALVQRNAGRTAFCVSRIVLQPNQSDAGQAQIRLAATVILRFSFWMIWVDTAGSKLFACSTRPPCVFGLLPNAWLNLARGKPRCIPWQRNHKIGVGCDAAEFVIIDDKARTAGLSLASYLRACALGSPGPRAKRSPPVNAEALAHAVAALNKAGNLANQIARQLNAGGASITASEYLAVLADIRAALDRILEIVGRKERQ